ncbi:hypothetical protein B2J88_50570 [Rhodococcus sp. SRB_17]|nr:hypothetical protein [Rhodococcus sp. SRB_17]
MVGADHADHAGEQAPTLTKESLNTDTLDAGVHIDPLAAAAAPEKNQSKRRSEHRAEARSTRQRPCRMADPNCGTRQKRPEGHSRQTHQEVLGHFKSAPIDQT